jgi:hypothetical protein
MIADTPPQLQPDQAKTALPHPTSFVRLVAYLGTGLTACSLLAFTALQYVMPESFAATNVLDIGAVAHFGEVLLGRSFAPLDADAYAQAFRLPLAGMWIGYALLVSAGVRGAVLPPRIALAAIVTLSLLMAVAFPASLSTDVYSYVQLARLKTEYGLDPYVHVPRELVDRGDPMAAFMSCWSERPVVWGGAWMLLDCIIVWVTPAAAQCWFQIVALKLLEAAALVGLALAGRALAEQLAPGRGPLALVAVGFNPLLLLEGPGNGHHDVLMMCLFVVACLLFLRGRLVLASLILGCAIGIKYVPLAVVPWLAIELGRGLRPAPWLRQAATISILAILPNIAALLLLGSDLQAVARLRKHEQFAMSNTNRDWHTRGAERLGLAGAPQALTDALLFLPRHPRLVVGAAYLALTVWVAFGAGRWMNAWVLLSALLANIDIAYPWYMVWPWAIVLTCWNRLSAYLFMGCFALSALGMLLYCRT